MSEQSEPKPLYEEVQEPFLPLRVITAGAGAASVFAATRTLALGARLGVAGLVASGIGMLLTEFLVPLHTCLVPEELQVRFGRRTRFRIPLKNVVRAYSRTYNPLMEYGGWGIRYGLQGRAFNMRGDQGVQLELRSGQRVLIGSQDPDALAEAIRKAAGCEGAPD